VLEIVVLETVAPETVAPETVAPEKKGHLELIDTILLTNTTTYN
jgi:hypothetical protein